MNRTFDLKNISFALFLPWYFILGTLASNITPMVAMSTLHAFVVAPRTFTARTPSRVSSTCRASRVVARAGLGSGSESDPESGPGPIGPVTCAVLSFHDAEDSTGRANDTVVPIQSWARRYGWDVEQAEKVLWQCDVFTVGAVKVGGDVPENLPSSVFENNKVVDATNAHVGLWVTHVFPDFCVKMLTECDEVAGLTKRQVLDSANKQLKDEHPNAIPSDDVKLEKATSKNTQSQFASILKALRRRFGSEKESPVVIVTRKVKEKRVHKAVLKGRGVSGEKVQGWEVVFGELGDVEGDEVKSDDRANSYTSSSLFTEMEVRRAARLGTMRLAYIKKENSDATDALDRARRERAAEW